MDPVSGTIVVISIISSLLGLAKGGIDSSLSSKVNAFKRKNSDLIEQISKAVNNDTALKENLMQAIQDHDYKEFNILMTRSPFGRKYQRAIEAWDKRGATLKRQLDETDKRIKSNSESIEKLNNANQKLDDIKYQSQGSIFGGTPGFGEADDIQGSVENIKVQRNDQNSNNNNAKMEVNFDGRF